MNFYTSDHHFWHKKIIQYESRPFSSVEEMNVEMICFWNRRVKPKDTVYHLGDFAFADPCKIQSLLQQLNGKKYLILGNHDGQWQKQLSLGWSGVYDALQIRDSGHSIYLHHYGCRVWNKSHYGSLHLYGHSHGSLPGTSQSLDVGVDCWDYQPVNLEEILERMKTLPPYRQEDGHQNG